MEKTTPLNLRVRSLLRQESPHLPQSCTFFSVYALGGGWAKELVGEGGEMQDLGAVSQTWSISLVFSIQ